MTYCVGACRRCMGRCMGSMSDDDWFHDESLRPSVLKWRVVNGHSLTAVDAVNQRRDSLCAREERHGVEGRSGAVCSVCGHSMLETSMDIACR